MPTYFRHVLDRVREHLQEPIALDRAGDPHLNSRRSPLLPLFGVDRHDVFRIADNARLGKLGGTPLGEHTISFPFRPVAVDGSRRRPTRSGSPCKDGLEQRGFVFAGARLRPGVRGTHDALELRAHAFNRTDGPRV